MGMIANKSNYKNLKKKKKKEKRKPSLAQRPLFESIPELDTLKIEDSLGYRKDIYAADFVDFDHDYTKTPRTIRPRTRKEDKKELTARSWVSSTHSSDEEEEKELPLDTFVDEPRLPNAFYKVRDAFTIEMDAHADSMEKLQELKTNLILEKEVNVVQRLQLKRDEGHTSVLLENVRDLQRDYDTLVRESEEEIEELYVRARSASEREASNPATARSSLPLCGCRGESAMGPASTRPPPAPNSPFYRRAGTPRSSTTTKRLRGCRGRRCRRCTS
jgi:hypothetical protein